MYLYLSSCSCHGVLLLLILIPLLDFFPAPFNAAIDSHWHNQLVSKGNAENSRPMVRHLNRRHVGSGKPVDVNCAHVELHRQVQGCLVGCYRIKKNILACSPPEPDLTAVGFRTGDAQAWTRAAETDRSARESSRYSLHHPHDDRRSPNGARQDDLLLSLALARGGYCDLLDGLRGIRDIVRVLDKDHDRVILTLLDEGIILNRRDDNLKNTTGQERRKIKTVLSVLRR